MPFTPYHFGPGFMLGFIFFSVFDLLTFLIASVIVDIEPLFVMLFNLNYPLHGFLHSFLGGSILALPLSLIMYKIKPYFNPILEIFKLGQDVKLYKTILASFIGVYFHIFLDSFLYTDIQPFFPFDLNPLYNVLSSSVIYAFCEWSFFIAFFLYLAYIGYILISEYKKPDEDTNSESNNMESNGKID
ncbi:MAG: conserved membrane protein of unknown function [Promethearchaeota archaeon]|nr:MAG: conserved membrane protein of unknown function [Candidatus Lokiarchaeota archaeon]